MNDEKIIEVFDKGISMNDACSELVERAIEAGGRDNITIVCVKL